MGRILSLLLTSLLLHKNASERNTPKVISPEQIPQYLLGGAILHYVSGDLSNCDANFLGNHSFGFGLGLSPIYLNYDDTREQKWYSMFSGSHVVDGRWEKLPGPADRYMYAVMVADGAGFMFTDLDPRNRAPVNPIAFINCKDHGIGGSVTAQSDVGTPLQDLAELKEALTSGYRVTFNLDLNRCQDGVQQGGPLEEAHSVFFGVMDNFRFNHQGDLATTSYLLDNQNMVISWLELRISSDNNATADVISISTIDGEQGTDSYSCDVGSGKGVALFKLQQ